jgi:FlaA1/EpsC-like NDP-sugar epimerase
MIHVSGRTVKEPGNPDGDIEITFSGLREGEKLSEQLFITRDVQTTAHPKILRAHEPAIDPEELEEFLRDLEGAIARYDEKLVRELFASVLPGFDPVGGTAVRVQSVQAVPVSVQAGP